MPEPTLGLPQPPTDRVDDRLSTRAARGAGWSALGFWLNKLVLFATSAVLAHLLTPRQFGLVAIAMVVVGSVERLSEGGLESAVVTFPGPDRRCFDHALGLSIGLGAVAAGFGLLTAPLVGTVFSEPEATPVVAALSVLYLTTSIRQTLAGALARRMQFARKVIPEVARALAKAVIMIGMALAGFGVWALTIGHLVGAIVGLAAYWIALGEPVRPRFSRPTSPTLLRAGASFSAVSLIGTVLQNADYVMLGLRANTEAVGLYSMGFRIPELTVLAIPAVASQALMASLSKVSSRQAELARGYLISLRLLAVVLIPVGAGISLVADDLVGLLFGDQWERSVPVVQLVGLYGVALGLAFPFGDAIKAAGRPGILVRLGLARLVFTLPVLWIAAGRGLTELAAVQLTLAAVVLALTLALATSTLGTPLGAQLAALLPAAAAGLVMVGAVLSAKAIVDAGYLRLLVSIPVGAGSYGIALLFLDRPAIDRLLGLLPARGNA